MIGHRPVDRALALDPGFTYVEDYLHIVDPELRLRKSANDPGFFVLERRCSRSRPVHTDLRTLNDGQIAARDGYVHVATVHRVYLDSPHLIVTALRADGFDLHAEGGAEAVFQRFLQAKATAKAVRRLKRDQDRRAYFREAYDLLNRTGGTGGTERIRITNTGLRPSTSTGESPVPGERTDVHSAHAPHAEQSGGLHHQAPV